MPESQGSIQVQGDVQQSVLVTGSHNVVVQAEQVMLQAAAQARAKRRDPARMLRILALLAAPVYDPYQPDEMPAPLDLKQEWHELAGKVRDSHAPILLARLTPPTLDALRAALSPRAGEQGLFPHVLHFSGHAWKDGLFLEDELGQVHPVTTAGLLDALEGIPRPLDLVVLNGCESAAYYRSVAQALVNRGLARAAVGHTRPVWDPQAIRFAARLYAELTNGYPLDKALARARRAVTAREVLLLGEGGLRFTDLTGGEPWVDDRRPHGHLPPRGDFFFGRGRDLVTVAHALAHPRTVVVISGPAGIGKTSLALEAAHRNAWRFPGGVAFVEGPRPEESRPATAADLLARLAERLEPTPDKGEEMDKVEDALWFHTARTPTLLVLDNLESLPEEELARLARSLRRLGEESAALVTLRPPGRPLASLPAARPLPLHHGIGQEAAVRYALTLAGRWGIPLTPERARLIARATDGHPLLVKQLVAQAQARDLDALLEEVEARRGDFVAQLEAVYAWSAERLDEAGRAAWRALLLFPAGAAPERVLWEAASREGVEALREAALADFDPAGQVWRWHPTVAEYARVHRPLGEEERRARLADLLPAWTAWLERLPEKGWVAHARLEAQQANLALVLDEAAHLPRRPMRAWVQALHRALPLPDRTLALRAFEERVYRTWVALAADAAERAQALVMLGYALSALGRREEALAATGEAVEHYRELARENPAAFRPDLAMSLNNLGSDLSALGRREEALAATREAVEIRRELARENPAAFRPDLAMSLNNLGYMLSALGRWEEALAAYEEAVRILVPFFFHLPAAFAPWMRTMARNYVDACRALGQEPDEALLEPVQEALASMTEEDV